MKSITLKKNGAFTLVEMMVVITIIGMLTGLLLVGVNAARKAAKRTAILLEMQQIDGVLKELKNQMGSFPPNLAHFENNDYSPDHDQIKADMIRFMKKAYPRHNEPLTNSSNDGIVDQLVNRAGLANDKPEGMNGAEAIVFWLGGFSDDPKYPISGKGGPAYEIPGGSIPDSAEPIEDRNLRFEFDVTRLGPRDEDGYFNGRFIEYDHPTTGNSMRINLWKYNPSGSEVPYIYYDTSRYKPGGPDPNNNTYYDVPYYIASDPDAVVYPLKTWTAGGAGGVIFANPKSFQLLHPGIDDEWGDFSTMSYYQYANDELNFLVYPTGPFREELSDTLTNFSTSTLEDSEP